MIIEKHKTIFVHIPKSAGTSILHYFNENKKIDFISELGMHDSIHQIRKSYPDLYKNYKKFSIVRNPYDKMVSWFFYLRKHECINSNTSFSNEIERLKKIRLELTKTNNFLDFIEFNAWVKDFSTFQNAINIVTDFYEKMFNRTDTNNKCWLGNASNFLNPQHTWLDDTVKIIKFENLNEELSDFFKTKIELPIKNESIHNHYSTYYNKKSLDIIYNKYEEDFKKFNYKKQ